MAKAVLRTDQPVIDMVDCPIHYRTTTHGEALSFIAEPVRKLIGERSRKGGPVRLSKGERELLTAQIEHHLSSPMQGGIDISRLHIGSLLKARDEGALIEFETLGPYLAHYYDQGGVITRDNLTPEDAIGLELAAAFRRFFPNGRLISLYDEYNTRTWSAQDAESPDNLQQTVVFSEAEKQTFRSSLVELFTQAGALPAQPVEGKDYLLLAESSKVADAELLVTLLEAEGFISRKGQEITFVNPHAENPLYTHIRLRTKQGRWLCEALDAATFLKPENARIVHVVVLPDYMKEQQDRVWEILRVYGIQPHKYHNIFYDPTRSTQEIIQAVRTMFEHSCLCCEPGAYR